MLKSPADAGLFLIGALAKQPLGSTGGRKNTLVKVEKDKLLMYDGKGKSERERHLHGLLAALSRGRAT